ncbi:MAG: anthranilate synthase component I family protein [Candidatus Baltobacteraceae bacterium]
MRSSHPPIVRTRTIASDTLTPILAYRALAQSGASCLLESVDAGGTLSRFSFVGFDYRASRCFESTATMYDEIRSFVNAHRPAVDAAPGGGALLAFSYDAARANARLQARPPDPPVMPAAIVAIPGTWLIFDHYTHALRIWCCGDDGADLETRIDGYVERLLAARVSLPAPFRARGAMHASMDRARYLALVDRAQKAIEDGEVYQLQLGIRFHAEFEGDPLDCYRALRRRNPSPYMFFVDTEFGALFGASPEFLVRLDGRRARIRPLAGTRARGGSPESDALIAAELLADEKERAEHVMLVDLGRNDLGSVCELGSVRVEELLQIERYSHVMHIVSDCVGELREDCDALDLFAAGFPAGTVTGTPKIRAMELIDAWEPVTRGFYAGSVGRWSFEGDFDSCITLRSLHAVDGSIWWQASAGIVADSVPASEYAEIFQKTRIAREVLSLQEEASAR